MKRALQVVGVLVVIAVIVVGGWYYYQQRRAQKAGIVAEKIVHQGNQWIVDFTAHIPAAEKDVFGAIEDVEDAPKYSSDIKDVKVLSKEGNKKTVEMETAGFGGQQLPTQLQFEYFPTDGKITYTTVNNPMIETKAEYNLKDNGGSTQIIYHQNTTMQVQLPVSDTIVKGFIRGLFIAQLEGIEKRLNITTASAESGEENADEEP